MLNLLLILIPLVLLALAAFLGYRRNLFQSGLRLVCTLLSAGLAVWTVHANDALVRSEATRFLTENLPTDMAQYFSGFPYGQDLIQMGVNVVMPYAIFVLFLLFYCVLSIVYLVAARFLSDNHLGTAGPEGKTRILLKGASILCSVLSCVIAFAMTMLPVTYTAQIALEWTQDIPQETFEELDVRLDVRLDGVERLQSNPVVRTLHGMSSLVTEPYTQIQTQEGETVSISEPVRAVVRMALIAKNMRSSLPEADEVRQLARQLESSPFLNQLLTQMTNDMVDCWGRGEDFLGIAPQIFLSPSISQMVYRLIPQCEDLANAMDMFANLLEIDGFLGIKG